VKWGKETYDVDVDTALPALVLKMQLFTLTGVPPERQKIMGVKNPPLKARTQKRRSHVCRCRGVLRVCAALTHRRACRAAAQDDADLAASGLKEARARARCVPRRQPRQPPRRRALSAPLLRLVASR
jgi:hypothetical protein